MRTTSNQSGLILFVVAIMVPSFAVAQRASEPEVTKQPASDDADELVIKVYRVNDLIVAAPNYAYEGTFLPGMSRTVPGANAGTQNSIGNGFMGGGGMGGMGGGMGGMGGGMGGMGGGMGGMMGATGGGQVRGDHLAQIGGKGQSVGGTASVSASGNVVVRQPSARITFGVLIHAITNLIDRDSWEENGGEGSIQPVGGALAVSNTSAVHAKLETFLVALRAQNDALRSISIDAHWLALDDEQLAKLRGGADKKRSSTGQGITHEGLASLSGETRRASAHLTCLNGQTIHAISGLMKTKIQGGIPVVGGSGTPGYQAVITTPHLGTLLQITPSLLPGDDAALVDLHSSVTRWEDEEAAVKLNIGDSADDTVAQIDRLKIGAQQLATSLRVPLGRPTLIGGMSQATAGRQNADALERLYLVIEITAPEDAKQK
jgi:hypothetical protein